MVNRRVEQAGIVTDVTDTAAWVAYFRALESERPDALFHDPYARQLAGDRGRELAERLPRGPLGWSLSVRTRVFDELICENTRGAEGCTVLNLAAGWDTRPYRLGLPPELRWIEVDLPCVVERKNELMKHERPSCHLERLAVDLADERQRRTLWPRLEKSRVLVVAEGLLAYLEESTVAELAEELRRQLPSSRWLLENVSPAVLQRLNRRWGKRLRAGNAAMKFAPVEGLDFFRRHGWVPETTRGLLDEAERLGREMPLVSAIRRISSFIPPLKRAYAKRQAKLRDAVIYAVLQPVGQTAHHALRETAGTTHG